MAPSSIRPWSGLIDFERFTVFIPPPLVEVMIVFIFLFFMLHRCLSAFICVPKKFGVLSLELGVKGDKAPF